MKTGRNSGTSPTDTEMSAESKIIGGLLGGQPETVTRVRSWIQGSLKLYRARLREDLEDLEQEVLADLIHALREGKFRGRCTLHTFVRAFAHHKCIDRIRLSGRRAFVGLDDLDLPSTTPSPFESLSRKEDLILAIRVLQQMPENCRDLWRSIGEGKKYREISEELGVSEGALRARALRCRRRALELRKQLSLRFPSGEK
jgi:RNA polymerase sigma factor (sigma-70 family)